MTGEVITHAEQRVDHLSAHGRALNLVQADTLDRYLRSRGLTTHRITGGRDNPLPAAQQGIGPAAHRATTAHGSRARTGLLDAPSMTALVREYGTAPVRWWLLSEGPAEPDATFTVPRMLRRADEDLTHGVGNLVQRVTGMVHRFRGGTVPAARASTDADRELLDQLAATRAQVGAALESYRFRRAASALTTYVGTCNRYVESAAPWTLAKAQRRGDEAAGRDLDRVLATLMTALHGLAPLWAIFLPESGRRMGELCGPPGTVLPLPQPLFPAYENRAPGSKAPASGRRGRPTGYKGRASVRQGRTSGAKGREPRHKTPAAKPSTPASTAKTPASKPKDVAAEPKDAKDVGSGPKDVAAAPRTPATAASHGGTS